jgi:hypothetical protein
VGVNFTCDLLSQLAVTYALHEDHFQGRVEEKNGPLRSSDDSPTSIMRSPSSRFGVEARGAGLCLWPFARWLS